jgi:hypothetical protein
MSLSPADRDSCLEILQRGLVSIRSAAMAGDAKRAEALADALHNLPRLLRQDPPAGWSLQGFEEMFLRGLKDAYPEDYHQLSQGLANRT